MALTASVCFAEGAVCSGFNPETQTWGRTGIMGYDGPRIQDCPKGFAYISAYRALGSRRAGKLMHLAGSCCPLPADALSDETVTASEDCPDGFLATGSSSSELPGAEQCHTTPESERDCNNRWERLVEKQLRCTKLNADRYQLGAATSGIALGWRQHFRVALDEFGTRDRLPVAFRYAVGRNGKMIWTQNACFGIPAGSWVTGKHSKYCDGFRFRELQYRGADGDPAQGTPVKWWDDCLTLDDPLSPNPRCIK